jgi:outer membrane protein assembly factor BamB
LPGAAGATPVIWDDSIFVNSPAENKDLLLICMNRTSGKERWRQIIAKNADREKGRNNMSAPSPVTDGKRVVTLFADGSLAAYDFAGSQLWGRDLSRDYGKFAVMWIYGSSPLLYDGRLFVQVLQRDTPEGYDHARDDKPTRESFLLCIDPATGTNLWRHIRPTDAMSEAFESYATPLPVATASGAQIVVVGGNYVTGHAISDGSEVWRCAGLNDRGERFWRVVPSPVAVEDLVVACGPKRDPVLGIRTGGKGRVTDSHVAWKRKDITSDCVTPLVYEGKLFVLDGDRQTLARVNPATGDILWQGNLGVREIFRASPTGADGRIYTIGESGTVVILGAGDKFEVLATIPMEEAPVRSSIAVAHGELFIRTARSLYCIHGSAL